jgi:hypothetical protein
MALKFVFIRKEFICVWIAMVVIFAPINYRKIHVLPAPPKMPVNTVSLFAFSIPNGNPTVSVATASYTLMRIFPVHSS